jgi:hypothetical protein
MKASERDVQNEKLILRFIHQHDTVPLDHLLPFPFNDAKQIPSRVISGDECEND